MRSNIAFVRDLSRANDTADAKSRCNAIAALSSSDENLLSLFNNGALQMLLELGAYSKLESSHCSLVERELVNNVCSSLHRICLLPQAREAVAKSESGRRLLSRMLRCSEPKYQTFAFEILNPIVESEISGISPFDITMSEIRSSCPLSTSFLTDLISEHMLLFSPSTIKSSAVSSIRNLLDCSIGSKLVSVVNYQDVERLIVCEYEPQIILQQTQSSSRGVLQERSINIDLNVLECLFDLYQRLCSSIKLADNVFSLVESSVILKHMVRSIALASVRSANQLALTLRTVLGLASNGDGDTLSLLSSIGVTEACLSCARLDVGALDLVNGSRHGKRVATSDKTCSMRPLFKKLAFRSQSKIVSGLGDNDNDDEDGSDGDGPNLPMYLSESQASRLRSNLIMSLASSRSPNSKQMKKKSKNGCVAEIDASAGQILRLSIGIITLLCCMKSVAEKVTRSNLLENIISRAHVAANNPDRRLSIMAVSLIKNISESVASNEFMNHLLTVQHVPEFLSSTCHLGDNEVMMEAAMALAHVHYESTNRGLRSSPGALTCISQFCSSFGMTQVMFPYLVWIMAKATRCEELYGEIITSGGIFTLCKSFMGTSILAPVDKHRIHSRADLHKQKSLTEEENDKSAKELGIEPDLESAYYTFDIFDLRDLSLRALERVLRHSVARVVFLRIPASKYVVYEATKRTNRDDAVANSIRDHLRLHICALRLQAAARSYLSKKRKLKRKNSCG